MQKKYTPLGSSNFKLIIEENRYYVDKTMLVRHVLKSNQIILMCRPRRFGKSLNLDMLHCFFAKGADNRHLFEGLNIGRDAECMEELGKYPVISVSFKDAKQEQEVYAFKRLQQVLSDVWQEHDYLAEHPKYGKTYNNWCEK